MSPLSSRTGEEAVKLSDPRFSLLSSFLIAISASRHVCMQSLAYAQMPCFASRICVWNSLNSFNICWFFWLDLEVFGTRRDIYAILKHDIILPTSYWLAGLRLLDCSKPQIVSTDNRHPWNSVVACLRLGPTSLWHFVHPQTRTSKNRLVSIWIIVQYKNSSGDPLQIAYGQTKDRFSMDV